MLFPSKFGPEREKNTIPPPKKKRENVGPEKLRPEKLGPDGLTPMKNNKSLNDITPLAGKFLILSFCPVIHLFY